MSQLFFQGASFNFMAIVTICSDFGGPQNKICHCFHCFLICLQWGDGIGCHDLSDGTGGRDLSFFSFEPTFSLSSFIFIKRLFSSSSLSAIQRCKLDITRQHIKKQRHYFANKGHLVKAIIFPLVMCGCESWTIKKAECWRIDPFELWGWRRLLRNPWTARRSNQSILKEISPGCSLKGLMLKLKLQYFGHLM